MILTGETEVLGEKHCTALVVDGWVWSIGGMILTGETEVLGREHYTASVVDEWMRMEHWWNDTDRGNWSAGRKTLCSVGGRWMNVSTKYLSKCKYQLNEHRAVYHVASTHKTLLFHLIFTSGHVFCWPRPRNISVFPENGPVSVNTYNNVPVSIHWY